MKLHAVDGEVFCSPQVGDERVARRVAGPLRVAVGDARLVDDVDGFHLDHPRRSAIAVSGNGLAALPPSEGERDGTIGDRFAKSRLEQHGEQGSCHTPLS